MIVTRSAPAEGIVLKRSNTGEADRIITILTKEYGKIVGVAKGVRKLSSSKKSYMEPGNHIKMLLVRTGSMPIITQASLIHQAMGSDATLRSIRSLVQWLEIMDTIFVEEELDHELYQLVLSTRTQCLVPKVNIDLMQKQLATMLQLLGFNDDQGEKTYSITQFVNTLSDRPLKGFDYLTV